MNCGSRTIRQWYDNVGTSEHDQINHVLDVSEAVRTPDNSRIRFMTDADEATQKKIAEGSCRLHYGEVGTMIHTKLYLLCNESTEEYRVITGSANFSEAAFSTENKNYETIRIDNNKDLFLTDFFHEPHARDFSRE